MEFNAPNQQSLCNLISKQLNKNIWGERGKDEVIQHRTLGYFSKIPPGDSVRCDNPLWDDNPPGY